MKYVSFVSLLGLAGCQSSPTPALLPAPPRPTVASVPLVRQPAVPDPNGHERKLRQQAQYIEALISQNDALTAKLAAIGATTVQAVSPGAGSSNSVPPPRPSATVPPVATEPTLVPNADNIIDLAAALVAEKSGEPVNPFTVRTVLPEAMREVRLQVGGIAAGPLASAVVNDRLVQVGEIIESLAVERIEPEAVLFRHSGRLLRLPVSEKATRVRLPL